MADTNGDGVPEVFADDMDGRVYGWDANGHRFFLARSNPAYSGKPLQPFVEPRYQPGQSKFHRTQHGFISRSRYESVGQLVLGVPVEWPFYTL